MTSLFDETKLDQLASATADDVVCAIEAKVEADKLMINLATRQTIIVKNIAFDNMEVFYLVHAKLLAKNIKMEMHDKLGGFKKTIDITLCRSRPVTGFSGYNEKD